MSDGIAITHRPRRPPRPGHAGEEIFAQHWEAENADPGRFAAILERPAHWLTQRHATLAATIVTWLGTNAGASFLLQAEKLAAHLWRPSAYVAQWTLENRRPVLGRTSLRRIEYMLLHGDELAVFEEGLGHVFRVRATIRDIEVAEQLAGWLGSDQGQRFIAAARIEIDRRDAASWRALRAGTRRMMRDG